ncbi:AraC family ligand binding domain-containing protein [Pseudoalteromonas sp. BSi20495]|uniref:AraC family ligand binding domain-containing protein n=1 Tax=Pseudoalteromonas sp. BSi20495 TaxID=386429 RepID=UPI0013054660|nr:AraC family ligand binding domain-containing protein [Pseudoalteromonas sp. BSi20495]
MSCSTAQITQTSYRYGCYMLVWVTQGKSQQWLDFKMMQAAAGTLIVVKPGQQVHCFGSDTDWQGWVMLFQPEALKRAVSSEIDIEQLPSISHYSDETVSVFTQITQDSL